MGKKTPEGNRRRLIEQARRKERAAERRRTIFAISGAVVAAVALVAGAVLLDGGEGAEADKATAELEKIGVPEAEANCAEVEHDDPISKNAKHKNGTVDWPVVPPTGGDHAPSTLSVAIKNFFGRDDNAPAEQAVHNMEHGWVVAWYDEKVPEEDVDALRKAAAAIRTGSRLTSKSFMVMPWKRGEFSDGRHVVLTAWGHRQRCGRVSGSVVRDFLTAYENKDAPEAGAPV